MTRQIDLYADILRFLRRTGDSAVTAIEQHLADLGMTKDKKTLLRILGDLERMPGRFPRFFRDDKEGETFRRVLLLRRTEGREHVWYLKEVEIRSVPVRYREELQDIRAWQERMEREYGPLARVAFSRDREVRVESALREIIKSNAGFFQSLSLHEAVRVAGATLSLMAARAADKDRFAADYRMIRSEILRTLVPSLFSGKIPEGNIRDTIYDEWIALADHLQTEVPAEPLIRLASDLPAARSTPDCATDSSVLSNDLIPSLRVFLGCAKAGYVAGDGPQEAYAYVTEPPLTGEREDIPPAVTYVTVAPDVEAGEDLASEYVRRMHRARLNLVQYVLETRILSGTARWTGSLKDPLYPFPVLHDGRALPELFRVYDFTETEPLAGQYAQTNMRTFLSFLSAFTSRGNVGRTFGMVKLERLPFFPLVLVLLAASRADHDNDLCHDALELLLRGITADPRFALFFVANVFGGPFAEAKGPFATGLLPRAASAFGTAPQRVRDLLDDLKGKDPTIHGFLENTYLPFLEEARIFYFFVVRFPAGGEPICLPRFEALSPSQQTEDDRRVRERALECQAFLLSADWKRDERHVRGQTRYPLYLPARGVDVDTGALIASEDLTRQMLDRIAEIRRKAREEGYPF